ncbi:MAG: hypothetical protein ACLGIO_04740 [Acidimicrobiia bacterium]
MSIAGALHPATRTALADGMVAGMAAWAVSGLPSTASALLRGADPSQGVVAAGTLLLPDDAPAARLVVAGAAAHTVLSLGWATVFALALPARRTVAAGLGGALAVAALDLGAIGRRYPRIRALDPGPQVADHLAFGAVVAAVVARRRAHR